MSQTLPALEAALRRAGLLTASAGATPALTGVTADSRAVAPGMVYVAVRGSQADGHRFVPDAVARGAAAVIVERPDGVTVPCVVVEDGRRAALVVGRAWHGDPGARLSLVGITGTNGKTTTTALVRHLLNDAGHAGSIGTLGAFDGAGRAVESTAGSLTTPGPIDLQATLAAMLRRGVTRVVMETSSHSLDQGRLDGLSFAAGVFTNLTRDHLDYHGTMEAYLAAKLRLDGLLAPDGVQVVNADDPAWAALPGGRRRVTFGLDPRAMVHPDALVLGNAGSRFRLVTPGGAAEVALPLLGEFNVANALAAAGVGIGLGLDPHAVAERLTLAPQVPGRMERLAERPAVVLRDYAHTPDALERALAALRPLTPGRLLVVFGCGGDRDRGKRPVMGRIATSLADLAIVTSDNPRTEDPERIIDDVEQGMGSATHQRVVDRRQAIAAALEAATAGDTILLAGKGHETYQVIGTEKVPFDERAIVLGLGAS
ncbi:MAG: UDP-N-acetylmuramoyl-L-alanyl-D-glutamate--2,6-diaminopimelate ligase [Gemmatimonadales bacterium]|nr:UDP-N-acetylmuramoyl-L-alanyl-D-glutamate--2,6-diaminopimelate ligase [Gemmatimonadota bacterium]MBP6669428.1 UDP-N-acetylmuramoyl-L-alanyl-D-glutamate--2,6-diaminopimelate ligase [Gemmatimonadales bacterium]MBK6778774.1 UDP-N-acetylmuramoyl-L-alanyl-D-glutamate--2,6-diaminopimelate ligase [Gemmatimonadota bacterium]MBK7348915.1 UDP-N-acetylmuramoyl-L-alanyl-D-glutamate--2,6-diaminopimelate ligase [Gemmatimonadota bacterium]MBK7783545.1 UDP-N-acetylmuramoyl-L-alanyl-D-glutamate--2,6-diaminop